MAGDRAICRGSSCSVRAALLIKERKDKVIRVLVLVAILEGEDLQHGVGQDVGDPQANCGLSALSSRSPRIRRSM